jgi:hypothetical protein
MIYLSQLELLFVRALFVALFKAKVGPKMSFPSYSLVYYPTPFPFHQVMVLEIQCSVDLSLQHPISMLPTYMASI